MPGPPITVQIKRKATEDPVDLLHVQNDVNGLRQKKQYVFKRQRTSLVPKNDAQALIVPSLLDTTQPKVSVIGIPRWTNIQSTTTEKAEETKAAEPSKVMQFDTGALSKYGGGISALESPTEMPIPCVISEPRQFHLSRSLHPQDRVGELSSGARGVRKTPTIFIERLRVKSRPIASKIDISTPERSLNHESKLDGQLVKPTSSSSENQLRSPAPLRNTRLPSGKVIPWNANSSQLEAEMQAYTMQEIEHNLNKITRNASNNPSGPILRPKQVSKFKPKPQPPRYMEPFVEQAVPSNKSQQAGGDEIMADVGDVVEEESSYVMDTYIRMPAEMFNMGEQKSVGVLVLESQPDVDDFYNDDSDSDSEIFDEEEDENAENHPSTDYPEDEIESDDEYGHNPYRYRNGNASDNEEFDLTHSDDDETETKPPWACRPGMAKPTYGEEYDDENEFY